MQETNEFYIGSAAELIEKQIKINSQLLDSVAFSVLSKYGFIEKVGKAESTGKRGRTGSLFKIKKLLCDEN